MKTEQREIRLCATTDLADPGSRGFTLDSAGGELELFVVRRGDVFRAYRNECPHTGGPLDWLPDQFLDADGRLIQCATHDALFEIETGRCVFGPCTGQHLAGLPVSEKDGSLYVVIPAQNRCD